MKIKIEITEKEIKNLIQNYIIEKFNEPIESDKIKILVKSKQNYKSEWENASFKAEFEKLY